MGPNDINQPLTSTDDVNIYESTTGTEVTSGQLYWADSETGVQTLSVVIRPYTPGVWHVEKRYFISICSIHSNSSVTDAGQISPTAGTVTIVVRIALFLCFLQWFFSLNQWINSAEMPFCHPSPMGVPTRPKSIPALWQ